MDAASAPMPRVDELWQALRSVTDPELGLNIVDLGLIYDVRIDGRRIIVDYTLTTVACALGAVIAGQIVEVLAQFPADEVHTELTFEPTWNPEMISREGKAFLGI